MKKPLHAWDDIRITAWVLIWLLLAAILAFSRAFWLHTGP